MLSALGICACWALLKAHAQLVADGATNVLDGVTTNVSGTITVGTNGSFTLLIVTNGATVSSTNGTYIGWNSGASSNSVIVTGPGSRWDSSVDVGESGAYNQLSILNGGVVSGSTGVIGNFVFSSNNLVLVSGTGSLWSNKATLTWIGRGGVLVVSNGGRVINLGAAISSGGRAYISGTGSVWRSASLTLGGSGPPNRLSVFGGASVTNFGSCTIGSASPSNSVLVTDPGTIMRISSGLSLGNGSGSEFAISNGAMVFTASTRLGLGLSTNLGVIIAGAGSLLQNDADVLIGQGAASNRVSVLDGGTLADAVGYVGGAYGFNQAFISGANSLWTNQTDLYVGSASTGNVMTISGGSMVCDINGVIGNNSSAPSNTVVVTGAGSLWTNFSNLIVGTNGSFNRLIVTNGGAAVAANIIVGAGSSGTNRVIVTDPGSILAAATNFFIGTWGNQLTVSNGATVTARSLTVGGSPQSGSSLLVDGGNVVVTNGLLEIFQYAGATINSGLVWAKTVVLQTGATNVHFNGGTLRTSGTASQSQFVVGNGSSPARFELVGGVHSLWPGGLVISSNATLTGTGAISGNIWVNPGASLAPGSSIGQITLNASLILSLGSTNIMELNADDGTCDNIVGPTNVVYGGTLILTNLAGVLADGSSFRLFSASNYSGGFSAIMPPSPGQGLKWNTNELNVDGVLRVFALHSPAPSIAGVQVSGSSIHISASGGIPYDPCYLLTTTNIASPTAWEFFTTNSFDLSGNAIFNPPFSPIEPLRFFRLQVE